MTVAAPPTRVAEPSPVLSGEARVLDAAAVCFGRWGISKTTVDDVARQAGISRATLYRLVPGGKPALVEAVGRREVTRLCLGVHEALVAADSLEDLLVGGIVAAACAARDHGALNYLVQHEPEVLMPFLAFDRLGPTLALATAVCAPPIARFVDPRTAEEVAEWAARLVISLTFSPGEVDLTDERLVRHLVSTFLVPGIARSVPSAQRARGKP